MNASAKDHNAKIAIRSTDLATRFPLLPRSKPPGRALGLRIAEIRDLTRSAGEVLGQGRLTSAAEALNKAALVASDCGLTDLARKLCWQQFDLFAGAAPLTARAAKLALQPIVNLGRLTARDGDGYGAYQIYESAYRSLTSQNPMIIDGRRIDLGHIVVTPEDRLELRRFLWTVLLADGTRALAQAGRWPDALRHVEQHKGIGLRMLDGRQVAVLARSALGEVDVALALLDNSATAEPWEEAVVDCLRTHCMRTANRAADTPAAAMVEAYLRLPTTPQHTVFRTRLGLSVADLAVIPAHRADVTDRIIREALTCIDARVASEVLSHPLCRSTMTTSAVHVLNGIVGESGFKRGTMPADLLDDLMTATTANEERLAQLLTLTRQR